MKKYQVGLLIGRFQPFHLGHFWLLKHALQYVNTLIIGVGSANMKNHNNNFLTYNKRKEMIQKVIESEKLGNKIIKIVSLDDFYNDEKWFKNSLKQAGKFDIVVGNNEWVNGIFESRGYPILRVGFYKRFIYEGERIRKLMKEGNKWQDRIPKYLIKLCINT